MKILTGKPADLGKCDECGAGSGKKEGESNLVMTTFEFTKAKITLCGHCRAHIGCTFLAIETESLELDPVL